MASVVKVGSLAGAIASASYMMARNPVSADRNLDAGSFFSGSSSSASAPSSSSSAAAAAPTPSKEQEKPRNDAPRTSAAGFDPEALERGAKALREINASNHAKKVFELMRKQEDTRQSEENARRAEYQALQAQYETERQKVLYEEQKKLNQQQAQTKAQLARYEDELTRKRMQAEHESNRQRNQELVRMQEEAAVRQEQIRRNTEEQIQAQRRQTEKEMAEIERETIRVKAMAEAEGRAHEAKMAEDVNRRLLVERANVEKDKLLAAINTTFGHIGGGLHAILTNRNKLIVAVGGATALAAGVYTTREGARVVWRHIDRILGQPSLIRESSRGKYPWSNVFSRKSPALGAGGTPAVGGLAERTQAMKNGLGFGDVILRPSLQSRVRQLASVTANTKKHAAPFRNMLFYGPPGTGKTMAVKLLAQESGLDYALMTGGDVAPLGANAVTKIHELFDWAGRSKKGLLLFIDEADAFLCERNRTSMSESQRSALNALLYRTGDQSRDIVMVLATNRPSDLDDAVLDRVDETVEFPLPGEEERLKLLNLYLGKYIAQAGSQSRGWRSFLRGQQDKIEIRGITDEVLREAAEKTEGFSGREIAKLMATAQGAVYGSQRSVLNAQTFKEVVDYKVAEHMQRRMFTGKDMDGRGGGTLGSASSVNEEPKYAMKA